MAWISHYPRNGHPLAPKGLREMLDVPVPSRLSVGSLAGVRLFELDESWWSRVDRRTCVALADLVVRCVTSKIGALPERVQNRRLPQVPSGITLDDLELERRTYNSLARAGYLRHFEDLGKASVGDILALPQFGAKSLVDLLTSLESVAEVAVHLNEGLTREAHRVLELRQARAIRLDDPRLSRELRFVSPGAETLGSYSQRLIERSVDPEDPELVAADLRRIVGGFTRLARMTLEEELYDHTFTLGSNRSRKIVARRFGWDGRGGSTLEAAGTEAGISRERVRQLAGKVAESLKGRPLFVPVTRRALRIVRRSIPARAEDVESALMAAGVTKRPFRLEGLRSAAQLTGIQTYFYMVFLQGRRFAVPPSMTKLPSWIARLARRTIAEFGVTTTAYVAAQVPAEAGGPTTPDFVAKVLEHTDGFKWLQSEGQWFWLDSIKRERNRLLNQIRKILAVSERIDVGELRQGLARHYRMKGFAPPQRVLLELCRQLPDYVVKGKTVSAQPPLDWRKSLGNVERTFVRVLKEQGPVMRREKLQEACMALGMNPSTFFVYLDYSPVLVKHTRGVYGLRGASISPVEVEHLRPKYKPSKVLVDYGWTPDARIWIAYRLSAALISTGVFSIPAGMKQFVHGDFSLRTPDGAALGGIRSADQRAWGLSPLFRRMGGEPGDHLVLVFDVADRHVTALIGDEQLIDEFAERR